VIRLSWLLFFLILMTYEIMTTISSFVMRYYSQLCTVKKERKNI